MRPGGVYETRGDSQQGATGNRFRLCLAKASTGRWPDAARRPAAIGDGGGAVGKNTRTKEQLHDFLVLVVLAYSEHTFYRR